MSISTARRNLDDALHVSKERLWQAWACIQVLLPKGKLGGTDVMDEIRLQQIEDLATDIARQAREAREAIESVRKAA